MEQGHTAKLSEEKHSNRKNRSYGRCKVRVGRRQGGPNQAFLDFCCVCAPVLGLYETRISVVPWKALPPLTGISTTLESLGNEAAPTKENGPN